MKRLTRNRFSLRLGAAFLCALVAGPLAAQDQIDLTFDEARFLGRQAALAGDARLALQYADSLLQADPEDFDAWIIRSAALDQLGDRNNARVAARRAYFAAPDSTGKYEAARLAALAARNNGQLGWAQWWLRLATVHAPTAADEAQTLQDAALVRSQSRWRTTLRLSLAPSDNVNGGAESAALTIDGLPFVGTNSRDALPLSGWNGSLGFSSRYTLSETQSARLTAGFGASWSGVWLSDEARSDLVAEDRYFGNRAFANYSWQTTLAYETSTTTGSRDLTLAAGNRYAYDNDDLEISRFLRLGFSQTFVLPTGNALTATAYADQSWDVDTAGPDNTSIGAGATYVHALPDVGIVSGTLSYDRTLSDIGNERYSALTLSAGFEPRDPVGPFDYSGHIGVQFFDYPDYALGFAVPGGRQDRRLFAGVNVSLPELSLAGFEPVVTLDASRRTSNVSRFEYDTFGVGLAFQSAF